MTSSSAVALASLATEARTSRAFILGDELRSRESSFKKYVAEERSLDSK